MKTIRLVAPWFVLMLFFVAAVSPAPAIEPGMTYDTLTPEGMKVIRGYYNVNDYVVPQEVPERDKYPLLLGVRMINPITAQLLFINPETQEIYAEHYLMVGPAGPYLIAVGWRDEKGLWMAKDWGWEDPETEVNRSGVFTLKKLENPEVETIKASSI